MSGTDRMARQTATIRHLPRPASNLRRIENKTFREWEVCIRAMAAQDGIPDVAVECLVRWARKKFAEYKTPPAPANLDNETQDWANELSDQKLRIFLELVTAQARLYGCQGPMS